MQLNGAPFATSVTNNPTIQRKIGGGLRSFSSESNDANEDQNEKNPTDSSETVVSMDSENILEETDENSFALPSSDEIAEFAADSLQEFHDFISQSGSLFGWGVTIPLASLAVRLLSTPLLYYNQVQMGRAALASKELPKIHAFVRATPGSIIQKYLTFRRLRYLAYRSAGTSGLKLFRWHMLTHIPLIISASMGIRRIAERAPQEWENIGFCWINNLAAADPTYALPIITTGLWIWNVDPRSATALRRKGNTEDEVQAKRRRNVIERIQSGAGETLTTGLQIFSVLSLGMTMELPAGIILFWTSNGVLTTLQRGVLSSDRFRRSVGLLTTADIENASGPPVLKSTKTAVDKIRKELEYVQREVLSIFAERRVNEKLCKEVNRMLEKERWNGRLSVDLEAVIREDDLNGKKYIAVVKKASG